jgi:hypothetical protein
VEEERNPGNQNDRHVVVFGWSPNTQQFYLQTQNPTRFFYPFLFTRQPKTPNVSLLFLCVTCKVALRNSTGGVFCNGSLLTETRVLLAAQCLEKYKDFSTFNEITL